MFSSDHKFSSFFGTLYFIHCTLSQTHLLPQTIHNEEVTNHYIGNLEMDINPSPIIIKEGKNITIHGTMQFLKELPQNTTIGLNFTYTFEKSNKTHHIPCFNLPELVSHFFQKLIHAILKFRNYDYIYVNKYKSFIYSILLGCTIWIMQL